MADQTSGEWPFLLVWVLFFIGGAVRGTFMHWLGRRVRRFDQGRKGLADRPSVQRAERLVRRFGAPAVALCYLTVGVQSAVMIASGVLLMPWTRFVPATLVGAALWATLYTTVGMSVLYAAVGRLDPWWLLGLFGVGLLVWLVTRFTGNLEDDLERDLEQDSEAS